MTCVAAIGELGLLERIVAAGTAIPLAEQKAHFASRPPRSDYVIDKGQIRGEGAARGAAAGRGRDHEPYARIVGPAEDVPPRGSPPETARQSGVTSGLRTCEAIP